MHSVEWRERKETGLGNTRLILKYLLGLQSSGQPSIRRIRVADTYRPLHVTERKRGKYPVPPMTAATKRKEYVVSVIKPRTAWAEMFYWWARTEVDPWPDENSSEDDESAD